MEPLHAPKSAVMERPRTLPYLAVRGVSSIYISSPAPHKPKWRLGTRSMLFDKSNVAGEASQLKRSEVVQLLQVAVNTLLLPANQQRLRERLQGKKGRNIGGRPAEIDRGKHALGQALAINTSKRAEIHANERLCDKDCSKSSMSTQSNLSPASTFADMDDPRDASSSKSMDNRRDDSLTDIRKLKVLNVHSYVHNALRNSAMRSWLQSRKIEE